MPGADLPLERLREYRGSEPCPDGFAAFWREAAAELDALAGEPLLERIPSANANAQYCRVTITAPDGCVLRAKYIRPATGGPVPTVLQFHDYPGASRGWFHLTRYVSLGYAVLAPDCRGQGGMSGNGPAPAGPMAYGPMFNGLEGGIRELYLFHLYQDALLWAKTLARLPGTDGAGLLVYGEGQGGALALACAAMVPVFRKCAAHYPMLCDYRRVWEMDFDTGAYEGLRFFFRWHDPLHQREGEIFRKLAFVDGKNFAPLVQTEVLMSTGLLDCVSPPSAQFAVFNALSGPKRHLVYPKHGHELNNFFEDELLKFFSTL